MNSNIDDEWDAFLTNGFCDDSSEPECDKSNTSKPFNEDERPEFPTVTDLNISTKSKIAFLNQHLDLKKMFWGIHILSYSSPEEGIIKKQMKFNSLCKEEYEEVQENLKREAFYEEQVLTHIDNPMGRIKFKDIRKVSVGISRKDMLSYRSKKKSAFYNCFVMIMRLKINEEYKEFHIKVFNTGKMEIPGVQNEEIYQKVLTKITGILQPFVVDVNNPLIYIKKSITILVNSNFNCGFYINREVLYNLLKYKYNIQCIYDPCSYPGIQCKFYYYENEEDTMDGTMKDTMKDTMKGTMKGTINSKMDRKKDGKVEVSFMIFRTGSILIVGMCEDDVLYHIYHYLKTLLANEYETIVQPFCVDKTMVLKEKKKKLHKRMILFENDMQTPFTSVEE